MDTNGRIDTRGQDGCTAGRMHGRTDTGHNGYTAGRILGIMDTR
jgi:hypothetical protein